MRIKLNKEQWEKIGKTAGWIPSESENKYYIETYIDGQQMLGNDGTTVLRNLKNLYDNIRNKIKILQGLRKIKPTIEEADNITLKLTDWHGNTLKTFDVTRQFSDAILAKNKKIKK